MTYQYYKFLAAGRQCAHGGRGAWKPSRWRGVTPPLVPCQNGLHILTVGQLPYWPAAELWLVEVHPDAEVIACPDKTVVSRARITTRVEQWDDRTARVFARDCAERAGAPDERSRRAVEVARRYADGEATPAELAAAAAAQGAATAAARAWAAAWAVAEGPASDPTLAAEAARAAEHTWQVERITELLWLEAGP